MTNVFDEISEVIDLPTGEAAPTNFLVVGEPALNQIEFECRCRQAEKISALKLPMPFEDENGNLLNADDFPETNAAQADAWIRDKEAPIRAEFAEVIEMARAVGSIAQ